jgi:hypothetical protein
MEAAIMHDRLKILKGSVDRYRWLLQTKLTAAQRKSATEMLGRKRQELKEELGAKRSWFQREILRVFKSRSDTSG